MRLRDACQYDDWQQKEEEFHLSQARVRSHIRIREGREKPIDLLAKNMLLASDSINIDPTQASKETLAELKHAQVELRPPEQLLVGLKIRELSELKEEINVYMELEGRHGEYYDFWKSLLIVCLDAIQKEHQRSSSRHAIHEAVQESIYDMLKGKCNEELVELKNEVDKTIDSAGSGQGIDVEYWESVLQEIKVHQAKARLQNIHSSLLNVLADRVKKQEEHTAYKLSLSSTSSQRGTNFKEATGSTSYDESREAMSMLDKEREKGMEEEEEEFGLSEEISCVEPSWSNKYKPRKPRFFNRVKTGYDWNKYNQTHYDTDNPPPKVKLSANEIIENLYALCRLCKATSSICFIQI
jgi:hypothetical protein